MKNNEVNNQQIAAIVNINEDDMDNENDRNNGDISRNWKKIGSCDGCVECQWNILNNMLYWIFGGGIATFFAAIAAGIVKFWIVYLFSPCNMVALYRKSLVILSCEAAPFSYKYDYQQQDNENDIKCKGWTQFVWIFFTIIIDGILICAHIAGAIIFFLLMITLPFARVHLQLIKVRICAFSYNIKQC